MWWTLFIIYGVCYLARANVIRLKYFTPIEFGTSWPLMSMEFLLKLDAFRERLGRPVMISPALGSLYRPLSGGDHSVLPLSVADIMLPQGPDLETARRIAQEVGFTAIGSYPLWSPYPGLHVAIRAGRTSDNPALWADIGIRDGDGKRVYVSLAQAKEQGFTV